MSFFLIKAFDSSKQGWLDQHTLQIQKLDRLLSLVRELPEGGHTTEAEGNVDEVASN